jgi:hypothetical protein
LQHCGSALVSAETCGGDGDIDRFHMMNSLILLYSLYSWQYIIILSHTRAFVKRKMCENALVVSAGRHAPQTENPPPPGDEGRFL